MTVYLKKLSVAFLSFFLVASSSLVANTNKKEVQSEPLGLYFGGFGGWGYYNVHVVQKGTAFFSADAGGPLIVSAKGTSENNGFGFGGLHVGYEWLSKNSSSWSFTPGVELEGYYFTDKQTADIENISARLDFHLFTDTFPMRTGVVMADGTLALTNEYIVPYIAAGVGTAMISIHNADSLQTDPPEPGVNHFNSDPDAFDWSFAAQAKGGVRYSLFKHMRLFAEYRFLYISPTHFTFGSTQYPDHVATSNWKVRLSNMYYNLFSAGIDFTF